MSDPMRTSKRSIHSSVADALAKSPTKFVIVVVASPPSPTGFVTLTTTSRKVDLIAAELEESHNSHFVQKCLEHM